MSHVVLLGVVRSGGIRRCMGKSGSWAGALTYLLPRSPASQPALIRRHGAGSKPVYVTVNVADGVNVWLRFLSTTFIFSVYWPGSSDCSGRSFSTMICEAAPGLALMSSLYSNTFSFDAVLTIS